MQIYQTTPKKLIRLPNVLERLGISKTEYYRRMKLGTVPKSIRLGVNSVAWLESDIDAYIQKLTQGAAK
jgi:prophage regulatory protein